MTLDVEALFAEADEVIEQSRLLTENARTRRAEPPATVEAKPHSPHDLESQLAIALQASLDEFELEDAIGK